MYSFPELGSHRTPFPSNFQDAGFSGRADRREVSAYESMDAGLTIKTREGDVVTLSTSRFSSLNASEYNSRGRVMTDDGQVSARYTERRIELASGEAFSFSVEGDLNEEELADIESIISGIDGIIYEMAEGDMDDAIAKALSMGSYDSVSSYEADITVAHAYSAYTETRATGTVPALPAAQGGAAYGTSFLPAMDSPFMGEVSRLLEAQDAEALAYARQPLSQLFDHYLEQQEQTEQDAAASEDQVSSVEKALKSPLAAALEHVSRTVDTLIQEMIKGVFDKTLNEMA